MPHANRANGTPGPGVIHHSPAHSDQAASPARTGPPRQRDGRGTSGAASVPAVSVDQAADEPAGRSDLSHEPRCDHGPDVRHSPEPYRRVFEVGEQRRQLRRPDNAVRVIQALIAPVVEEPA
jgi:hypothetical protein